MSTINGTTGPDGLNGGSGDDSIAGDLGNDTISAGTGQDTVDGGGDWGDRLVLQSSIASYTVTQPDSTHTRFINATTGEDVTVSNVEFVQFSDGLRTIFELRNSTSGNQAPLFSNAPAGVFLSGNAFHYDAGGPVVLDAANNRIYVTAQLGNGGSASAATGGAQGFGETTDLQVWAFDATTGALDTAFSGDGNAVTSDKGFFVPRAATLDSNGKLVVAGIAQKTYGTNNFEFALVRYNTNGTLDTTFDSDGIKNLVIGSSASDQIRAIVALPGGKILVGGSTQSGTGNGTRDFALAQFNADGTLDTSFNGTGTLVVPVGPGSADQINGMSALNDGSVIVLGTRRDVTTGVTNVVLIKYTSTGDVDTSFGFGGYVIKSANNSTPTSVSLAQSLYIQGDGKIVVTGFENSGRGDGSTDLFVARLEADGRNFDTSFTGGGSGTGGFQFFLGEYLDQVYKVTEQADGKILLAGLSFYTPEVNHGALVRLNPDGSLDTTFGNGGVAWSPFRSPADDGFSDVAVQADGKIVVSGFRGTSTGASYDTFVLRLNADGTPDTTFNAGSSLEGKVLAGAGGPAAALAPWASIFDGELNAQDSYAGATLTLVRQGGAVATDQFGASGGLSFSGGVASLDGLAIGTVTTTGGTLVLHLNGNASQGRLNDALSHITWQNGSVTSGSTLNFSWTFDDGSGAGNASVTATSTLNVVPLTAGNSGNDTLGGTGIDDAVYGGPGNDNVSGGGGDDFVSGGDGNDLVSGGTGNDTLDGGLGTDTLVGGAGDDIIDGGQVTDRINYTDRNALSYGSSTNAVNIDLSGILGDGSDGTGTVHDGYGNIDTVSNVNFIVGSNSDDTIVGSSAAIFEQFEGGKGNDFIDGGALRDSLNNYDGNRLNLQNASSAETVDLIAGTASGGDGSDTLRNINQVRGSAYNDSLYGSDRTDYTEQFEGMAGNDLIDGRGGFDIVRYDNAPVAVSVNLALGTTSIDGFGGTDTLVNIEGVQGSAFDDTLIGGNAANGVVLSDGLQEVFRGGAGNDLMDGGQGYDRVDFTTATTGVFVQLNDTADGTAIDGQGGNDTLRNIEAIRGSDFDDTLLGSDSAPFESFDGRVGNDSIDGKGGTDRADYINSVAAVNVDLVTGVAQDGWGGTDTLAGIEWVRGSRDFNDTIAGNGAANSIQGMGGNDSLSGGGGNDTLQGGGGNDTLDGGSGTQDRADFSTAGNGVNANLASGTATGEGSDSLVGIEYVIGSNYSDTLVGDAGENGFTPGGGNDTVDGGAGLDWVFYGNGVGAVAVNLTTGAVTGAMGNDSLTGIEHVSGSNFDDTITGSATAINLRGEGGNDKITGGSGNEYITGGAGNDTLDGGTGIDTADYFYSSAVGGVNVNLGTGSATGGDGTDVLSNIENVNATNFNDTLTGDANANFLQGEDGNDSLSGAGGNDTLDGGNGNDTLVGGLGNDSLIGGAGFDWAGYGDAAAAVVASLVTGSATGGAGIDTLSGIENLEGSTFADSLTGNDFDNVLRGGAGAGADTLVGNGGNDVLNGGLGNDNLQGGAGFDTADYSDATGAVGVNLAATATTGTSSGAAGIDTLSGIEAVLGSAFNDTITGDAGNNFITGNGGNDLLNGGGGFDTADYGTASGGVQVSLVAGSATGAAGTDTLSGFEGIRGSAFDDVLTGDANNNDLNGGAGNDSLVGGAGTDSASYWDAAAGVNVSLAGGSATGGAGTDTLVGIENLNGSGWDDTLTGDGSANFIDGGQGNDAIDGGGGTDTVGYGSAQAGVSVNLANGAVTGGAGNDTLSGIEAVVGSAFGDTLLGTSGNDTFTGGQGNDSIDGGSGSDWVQYGDATAGVNANLATGVVSGGAGNDTLVGIENIGGSGANDTIAGSNSNGALRGEGGADLITGGTANDYITGGAGNDTIDGGAGADTADYFFSSPTGGVNVNLATGVVSGGDGADVLSNIENVNGTNSNDTITGDAGSNSLQGNGGNDLLSGGAGNDTLLGDEGADTLLGGAGSDFIRGGAGNDSIDGGVVLDRTNFTDGNSLSYSDSTAAINLNLSGITGDGSIGTGTAQDGLGGTDTVANVSFITGSGYDDTIVGSGARSFEQFEGGAGNDTIDGGALVDTLNQADGNRAAYVGASGAVQVDLGANGVGDGTATGGAGSDRLLNINQVRGSGYGDVLTGSDRLDFTEQFEGRAGNDTIDGKAGFDIVRYDNAGGAVTVDLVAGTATGADGSDTLHNIEGIFGSAYGDKLTGGNLANGENLSDGLTEVFRGGGGNDTIDGGAGYDRVDYTSSTAGVVVQLNDTLDGAAQDGLGGTDVLRNIEGVRGSDSNDMLTGSDSAAFESFEGRAGNDAIDGKGGFDRADYFYSYTGVNVSLATGTASDGWGGTDTLAGIEWVRGSRDGNDILAGDGNGNRLDGNGGNDFLDGAGGNDTLRAGAGVDTVDGGLGDDTLVVLGAFASYTVNRISAGDTQLVNVATQESIVLRNVETVSFTDGSQDVAAVRGQASTTNLVLTGTTGNDTLIGFDGNDFLNGQAGNDSLIGNGGNDTLQGGAGNDAMDGGPGSDWATFAEGTAAVTVNLLTGTATSVGGTDTLTGIENVIGTSLGDNITGDAGNNVLDGGSGIGIDTLVGGDGNDVLHGGLGNDNLQGGAGFDTADYSDATGAVGVNLAATATTGTSSGAAGIDTLSGIEGVLGSASNDTITGDAGNNFITGNGGNDLLNGGGGFDTADYGTASGGVQVSLVAGSATGAAGTDTLSGFEGIRGSAFDDVLTGDANNNDLNGGAGNDSLVGGAGTDSASYWDAAAGVNVSLAGGSATGGAGTDTLVGIENLNGSGWDDTLTGDGSANFIDGGQGNDAIDGGAGVDTVGYGSAQAGVSVNLANGAVTGGAGNDTLSGIEAVVGSAFGDTLLGTSGNDTFTGGQGNDSIDGGSGSDWVQYGDATAGVNANLATGVVSGGAGNDTLVGIENIGGSGANDTIAGSNSNGALRGEAGNDLITGGTANDYITGGAGNDTIDGGAGTDTADYFFSSATAGVNVNLATGVVSGGDGADVVSNIENVNGTNSNDTITGSAGSNYLQGQGGNDSLVGGGGRDTLEGGSGNDTLDGGAITDRINYTDLNFVTYANAGAGVNLSLQTGVASDGQGGTDTLVNINFVFGSGYDDTLVGSTTANLFEQFEGGAGNDSIDGGAIDTFLQANANRASYQNAAAFVTVDLAAKSGSGSATGNDTLLNINQVTGSAYGDTLLGSDSALTEQFEGRGGDDLIDGRGGIDIVRYDGSNGPVNVDLSKGTGSDGFGGNDTLLNIEGVRGSAYDDILTGGAAANGSGTLDGIEIFMGNAGNDQIAGGAGYDRIDYATSTQAVVVTFTGGGSGTAQDGLGGTDTFTGIEAVRGSAWNDTLIGSSAAYESFEGREGSDSIDGGGGYDRVDYQFSAAGVNVNLSLATGTASDGSGGTDTLLNIEGVRGSSFNDTIVGSAAANKLEGLAGSDNISAGEGDDTIDAGTGSDTVDGGGGSDTLLLTGNFLDYQVGRTATDTILTRVGGGEVVTVRNVESLSFADGVKTLDEVKAGSLSAFDDNYTGTSEAESINGLAGNDTLTGLGGDDTLIGGLGNDSLVGGQGNDLYEVDSNFDTVVELPGDGIDKVNVAFLAAGTYTLASEVENATVTSTSTTLVIGLAGNGLDNLLVGNALGQSITGAAGNDTLDGGAGNDTLVGGADDDRYVVNIATDVVTELANEGTDTVVVAFGAAGTYVMTNFVENATVTSTFAVNVTGNGSDNNITGNALANILLGNAGNDTLAGGAGNDTIDGGAGADNDTVVLNGTLASYLLNRPNATDITFNGNGQLVTVRNVENFQFTDGTRTLSDLLGGTPSAFNDILIGTSGNDSFNGLAGNDSITTFGGSDTLVGGAGNDTLVGGDNNDVYEIDALTDVIVELAGEGTDTVGVKLLVNGNYTLGANIENATVTSTSTTILIGLIGNELDNVLVGNNLGNALTGGIGNDTLDGGLGNDTMAGGVGDDTYVVNVTTDVVNETALGSDGIDTVRVALATGLYTLGTNIENGVIVSTANGVNLTGNGGANTLTGGTGNNILSGGADDDTFIGGGGVDTIDGGTGSGDVLVLSGQLGDYTISRPSPLQTTFSKAGAVVTVTNLELVQFDTGPAVALSSLIAQIGSTGDDPLTGLGLADVLDGGAGNDTLSGLGGNDTLLGGTGNDLLIGGDGADWLDGGDGSDTYRIQAGEGDDLVVQNDTTVGTDTVDVRGDGLTADNISFTRGYFSFDDLVVNITVGEGDSATVDHVAVIGFFNDDAVNAAAAIDQVTVTNAAGAVVATISQADILADLLNQVNGSNVFVGYASNDSQLGGVTDDWMLAGAGNDTVDGGAGNDLVFGASGADSLQGGDDNDTLIGGAGNDTLIGGTGDDTLSGGAGSDTYVFTAGAGHDVISEAFPSGLTAEQLDSGVGVRYVVSDGDSPLGSDNDTLSLQGLTQADVGLARNGDDLVVTVLSTADSVTVQGYFALGTPAIERLLFSGGKSLSITQVKSLVLVPTAGDDSLVGSLSGDKLNGLAGNDRIDGREGNDTINGGAGNDTLTGGAGADRFVFDSAPGAGNVDTVTDFTSGFDTLALSRSVFTSLAAAGTRMSADGNVLLYNASTGEVSYDADGAGSGTAVVVAILGTSTHPATLGADFLVI